MSPTERALLDTLLELDRAVVAIRTAQARPDLQAIFRRLDELTAQLPRGTDPDLLHYLHRKSYEKARLHLEGRQGDVPSQA